MVKTQSKNGRDATPRMGKNLDRFLNSLSDLLSEITAVEVNTMVVEEITANKFIPWEAYRDIYLISERYLQNSDVAPSLYSSYLSLRRKLEMEYCVFLLKNKSSIEEFSQLGQYSNILSDPTVQIDEQNTVLPSPLNLYGTSNEEIDKIHVALENGKFLRSLRKMSELKIALDNRNMALKNREEGKLNYSEAIITTDIIYAQSVIQLDGEIINRYHQKLLEQKHKDAILDIHRQGSLAGQKHWQGLLEFIVNLVESFVIQRSSSNKDLLNRN